MNRVALVTGAARGIGAAVARALAAQGDRVAALDACRDDPAVSYPLARPADLDAVVAACDGQAIGLVADVRDGRALRDAVADAQRQLGPLDAVVAAAGVIQGGRALWETPDEHWDVLVDVDLTGVHRTARMTVPALLERPEPRTGRFVAVASAAGLVGLPRLAAYSAAKHGVVGLVRGLAADLAGTGVTANAVCPGSTRTAMLDASAALYGLDGAEGFADQQLVRRLLEPDEPAALIAWLCGRGSSAVTGAALPVDGGLTTHQPSAS